MLRHKLINAISKKIDAKSYFEIGLEEGCNFKLINCENKFGVDPEPREWMQNYNTFNMTSDDFFLLCDRKFDLIFIDGLHHEENLYRDITNSLNCLNDGGIIVCHDLHPVEERHQIVPRICEEWTGDVWKAWVKLRSTRKDLNMFVVDLYLPPLDGTDSENAINVVENSPKLLYTCKAISKVLEYAYTEQGQRYSGAGEADAIMGQVVYANNYKFRYHGKDFFLFDLMTKYIIDENKELLEKIVKDSGREVTDLFSVIDGRTKSEKTQIVQDFKTRYCLILFGT